MTFTIWPNWKKTAYGSISWLVFLCIYFFTNRIERVDTVTLYISIGSIIGLIAIIRRERIEIYPDSIIIRQLYLGIPRTRSAPFNEVLGVEWNEGNDRREDRSPSYLEFYTSSGSIRGGYTLTFEEYEVFRAQVRMMYPELDKRWGKAVIRSKDLTLLNLT